MSEQTVAKPSSSGLATIGGAAIGGLLGNQVGGGRGKTAATVTGVVAGGAVGHQASKSEETHYEYIVHMDHGEKFILETNTRRKEIGSQVIVENLSNGRERINVLP
ncbi:glycine zipper 2TM domain-containing protein [Agarivorans sp. DSG3-1]|uniref:glycine zipper 2TM domain-containing protein n=1 Tax=Agarivorans sp. DSG3-1 TaxID=3342249 RepID=UPI00398F33DA